MPLEMNREVFITCAVTGSGGTQDRSPHVPRAPKEIADSAIEAAKAGAEEAAQDEVCQAANDNDPAQVVVSGHKAAVERAVEIAKEKGARRAVMLLTSPRANHSDGQNRADVPGPHAHPPRQPCPLPRRLETAQPFRTVRACQGPV